MDRCIYSPGVHYTREAMNFHTDKCVSKWMGRMTNPKSCVEYMSGVARGNPQMQHCTVSDLENICDHKKDRFTVEDARHLCHNLNEGHAKFWRQWNLK
jgi:hypothetical protein